MIVDNFLKNFGELLEYAENAEFKDEVNEVDGVTYPLICKEIPETIKTEVLLSISGAMNKIPKRETLFMRRSPEGVHCPHKVHSDNSMGDYSLMLYLDDREHGTSFLNHLETGAKHTNYPQDVVDKLVRDQNDDDAWEVYQMHYGKPNRALIFDAHLLHRAEPVGGYGQGNQARAVLTCFFS